MSKQTDIQPVETELYFLPVKTRIPLKFGTETLTSVTCVRVCMHVKNLSGELSSGWGETPLSVQWAWPSKLPYEERHQALKDFCILIAEAWSSFDFQGHPMEIGYMFIENKLSLLLKNFNNVAGLSEPMPYLAALVCCSAFDIALHDAYGISNNINTYETYNSDYMNEDLSFYLTPAEDVNISFKNKYPSDFFVKQKSDLLPVWHLVGGKDLLDKSELTGNEPDDGYPVVLTDWIRDDGLKCLKVKLVGNDSIWDYERLCKVGKIALENNVNWLTADFNCTVTDPCYVNNILDRLVWEYPRIAGMILYVEQPFPYDLENNRIDVHGVSARKPLFMDESAHDWKLVRLGRKLGWTGVALKTCKTQTGALLSGCWAKAHGMTLMVQDLTNLMLAQIPHVLLAANIGTIMGVESNGMQFYPEASSIEAEVHPGVYKRNNGALNISSLHGLGFGYSIEKIRRKLPEKYR